MTKDRTLSTAIQIMTILAYRNDMTVKVSSETLAGSLRSNPGLVRRVLSKLAKAGLVNTQLGRNGGASLARPASKISLRDVYDAVNDGPLFGTFEKAPLESCKVSCQIGHILGTTYEQLQNGLRVNMEKIKVSDLVKMIV